jgi:hypothetical protein
VRRTSTSSPRSESPPFLPMATSSIPPDLVVDPRLHYPRSRVVTNRDERCPLLDDARIPQVSSSPPQILTR